MVAILTDILLPIHTNGQPVSSVNHRLQYLNLSSYCTDYTEQQYLLQGIVHALLHRMPAVQDWH